MYSHLIKRLLLPFKNKKFDNLYSSANNILMIRPRNKGRVEYVLSFGEYKKCIKNIKR